MTEVAAGPCSAAMSFSRAPPGTSAERPAPASSRPTAISVTEGLRMSEHHVQRPDQPARFEVVLDETLAEIADLHLADGRGGHHVARADVGRAHDAGQHDELAVAVDVHLADAFEHEVVVGQDL